MVHHVYNKQYRNENHHHSGLVLSGCYYIKTNILCGDFLIEIDDDYLTPPETYTFIPKDGMMLLLSLKKNLVLLLPTWYDSETES